MLGFKVSHGVVSAVDVLPNSQGLDTACNTGPFIALLIGQKLVHFFFNFFCTCK